ncbi:MAG TPA: response regulator transcription factor [Pyrinomonadaceae bacterium]|jgi:DNA-binding response OmpR family regulator|nr:response regulator transcription factor [Pyrinomonadaceae bacterium]
MSAVVLIVEDEKHLADGLRFNLEDEGYSVLTVGDGEAALALLTQEPERFDAVVLDVMLPGIDGFTVASELRRGGQFVPILMLTARGRPEDVLRGFESGADDYLAKPFELSILVARLRGLLRRSQWSRASRLAHEDDDGKDKGQRVEGQGSETKAAARPGDAAREQAEDVFAFNGKIIDFGELEIRAGERVVRLTLMEAELLRYLIKHAGHVVSRKAMLEDVWGLHEDTDTRAIDNFIVRLRRYIEDEPSKPEHLLTVRGIGYRFVVGPDAAGGTP